MDFASETLLDRKIDEMCLGAIDVMSVVFFFYIFSACFGAFFLVVLSGTGV